MPTYDKSIENKQQSISVGMSSASYSNKSASYLQDNRSGSVVQKKDGYLVDNRPESVIQRKSLKKTQSISLPYVLQAVWKEKEDQKTLEWSDLIDGVQWFSDENSLMWFEVTNPQEITEGKEDDYKFHSGEKNKKSYQEWSAIYHSHLSERVGAISKRIQNYRELHQAGIMTRDTGSSHKAKGLRYIDDEHKTEDTKTKFLNHYSTQETVMDENYRIGGQYKIGETEKKFYASDVYLDQYSFAVAQEKNPKTEKLEGDPLGDIPSTMPKTMKRSSIVNKKTVEVIEKIFKDKEAQNDEKLTVAPNSLEYGELIKTDNGATTIKFLGDFNTISRHKGGKIYKVKNVNLEKKPGWNMSFNFEEV